jgi:hypothetical protein
MQNQKCEQCGGELEFRTKGSVQGYFCKTCDWALVTTFIPDIQLDETIYKVTIADGDYRNKSQIKAVAEISNINFLSAQKLLRQRNVMIFQGEAPRVLKVRDTLNAVSLTYDIQPPFPY